MPTDRLTGILDKAIRTMESQGTAKGREAVVKDVLPAAGERGPRYLLEGFGEKPFLRMNANSYLGLSRDPRLMRAEEEATASFGAGPGAVRFIAGTHLAHTRLETELAAFHGREAAVIYSSAYAAVLSAMAALLDSGTLVLSDELNHNCIINGIRMSRPGAKEIYPHLDLGALERGLKRGRGRSRRAVVVTDGVFSMRGDHAPLDAMMDIVRRYDEDYPENAVLMVDDSHGVGAFGKTGRGTEEFTESPPSDILIGTLGKAFGVNGGYIVASSKAAQYLRETSPLYIYSNPITAGEASAARAALAIVAGREGPELLKRLRRLTRRFESGLLSLGREIIPGPHPVVPLLIRDTTETKRCVEALFDAGILATGLAYPVVPKGDEEIRFQINADHTPADIDFALEAVAATG